MIKEIKANIDYLDCTLNKNIIKGADIISLYNEANIELSDERIAELEKGNVTSEGVPFINVVRENMPTNDNEEENKELDNEEENEELNDKSNLETADLKKDNVETAMTKPARKNNKREEK